MRRTTIAALLGMLLMGGASAGFGLPEPVTERGEIIEGLYVKIMIAGIITFAIVMAVLAWILIRYREGSGFGRATYEKHRENVKAEFTWTFIPLIVVLWIGFISFQGLIQLDEVQAEGEPYTTVYIEGYQWFWQAKYDMGDGKFVTIPVLPGAAGDLTNSEMIGVPANVPVKFDITGMDVIHSFYVDGLLETLDAVPGIHNSLTAKLPVGTYFTQCKQNCANPGHGYMRAKIDSMPVAQFEAWLEAKAAGAAAGLQQVVPVVIDGSSIVSEKYDQLAMGATIVYQLANGGAAAVDVTVDGETINVPANGFVPFETKYAEAGIASLTTSTGGSLNLQVVEPVVQKVELGAFKLIPATLKLEPGTMYLFEADNTHTVPHNLYLGDFASARANPVAFSKTIGGGEKTSFLFFTPATGSIEMYCDVSGHYESGMKGTVTIG